MPRGSKRQKDKYYHLAKEQGYRARSAFKLVQLDNKYKFLSSARCVIDLCAAPGGWLQVASKYAQKNCKIIGVDLVPIKPIPNVITHATDITTAQCRTLLKKDMGSLLADAVLHDGAPNVGAAWVKDAYGQNELTLHALKLAVEFLRPGGMFLTKVFRSSDYHSLLWVFNQLFTRVEATKPHSSRNASAEIFVACQGFTAPARIDPRLLSPEHVFKAIDEETEGTNVVDVFHSKHNQTRHRQGYDETLGQTLHRKLPVMKFIESENPQITLSTANQLVFDGEGAELLDLPETTDEIKACCEDLKVLGKADFKALMKWRLAIVRKRRFEMRKAKAEAKEEDEDAAAGEEEDMDSAGEGSGREDDEDGSKAELAAALQRLLAEKKRDKKKAAKLKNKALRRKALGIDGQAVDLVDSGELFSLSNIRNQDELNAILNVDLTSAPATAVPEAPLPDVPHAKMKKKIVDEDYVGIISESEDSDELDSDAEADYQQVLEDQMERDYEVYRRKRTARETATAAATKPGKKLTRRQKLEQEAELVEKQALEKLDATRQEYLRMLEGAKGAAGSDGDDSDDDYEDSDGDSDASEIMAIRAQIDARKGGDSDAGAEDSAAALKPSAKKGKALIRSASDIAHELEGQDFGPSAAARAARFFSQPLFDDITAEANADSLSLLRGKKNTSFSHGSDLDSSDDDAGEDSKEESGAGSRASAAKRKSKSKTKPASGAGEPTGAQPASPEKKKNKKLGKRERERAKAAQLRADAAESKSAETKGKAPGTVPAAEAAPVRNGGAGLRAQAAPRAGAGIVAPGRSLDESDGDYDDDIDPLAGLPKSERQKRKDRLRKQREKAAKRADQRKRKDGGFEVVPGQGFSDDEGDDAGNITEEMREKMQMIREGMGTALEDEERTGAKRRRKDSGFEVVPASAPRITSNTSAAIRKAAAAAAAAGRARPTIDKDPMSTVDPRTLDYDSDTHAEMLALGLKMRKHTTAKALLDASYNRYAFNDPAVPQWFADDENKHFKPTLPVSKDEVERIKASFRDIAARPIKKVAEARARKKGRAQKKLEKAKRTMENITESSEMGDKSKLRAIQKAWAGAHVKEGRKKVLVVARNGRAVTSTGRGAKGAQIKHVDSRLRSDTKNQTAAAKGKRTRTSRGKHKVRHKKRRA